MVHEYQTLLIIPFIAHSINQKRLKLFLKKIGYAPTGKDYFSKGEHKVYVRDLIAQTEYCDNGHVTEFEYEV